MAIKQLGVLPTNNPVTQALGDTASKGTAGDPSALESHKHGMPTTASVATSVAAQTDFSTGRIYMRIYCR